MKGTSFSITLFYEMHLLDEISFYLRPFDKIRVYFVICWRNLHFPRNPLIKFANFLQSLDEICIFFTIFWQNLHLFHNPLTKFSFFHHNLLKLASFPKFFQDNRVFNLVLWPKSTFLINRLRKLPFFGVTKKFHKIRIFFTIFRWNSLFSAIFGWNFHYFAIPGEIWVYSRSFDEIRAFVRDTLQQNSSFFFAILRWNLHFFTILWRNSHFLRPFNKISFSGSVWWN